MAAASLNHLFYVAENGVRPQNWNLSLYRHLLGSGRSVLFGGSFVLKRYMSRLMVYRFLESVLIITGVLVLSWHRICL